MKANFTIFGRPQGKGRPRFGQGRTYTPKATRDYELRIADAYRDMCRINGTLQHFGDRPIRMEIIAFYPLPKSSTKAVQQAAFSGEIYPMIRPDLDNIVKTVMDALNGVAYDDDKQVMHIVAHKRFGIEGMVSVMLTDEVSL